jgi:hypothetical protein
MLSLLSGSGPYLPLDVVRGFLAHCREVPVLLPLVRVRPKAGRDPAAGPSGDTMAREVVTVDPNDLAYRTTSPTSATSSLIWIEVLEQTATGAVRTGTGDVGMIMT